MTGDLHKGSTQQVRIAALALPAVGFERLTFPRYRPMLLGTEQPEFVAERIAVAAYLGNVPAGLALFSRAYGEGERRLMSVMVSPILRRQGLGARMLMAGEQLCAQRDTQKLTAIHSSQTPSVEAYEALMRKTGWSAPKELEYRLAGKASWAFKALEDWAAFLRRLYDRGYGTSDWRGMTTADRERVAWLVEHEVPEADRQFDPFRLESKLEIAPEISLLLRKHGEIVGWIVGSKGMVGASYHYSTGYVLPALQRAGWLVAGVRDVCQRQAEIFGGDTLSVFETTPGNQGMRRFMERQLKPYSTWTDARYLCEKLIAP